VTATSWSRRTVGGGFYHRHMDPPTVPAGSSAGLMIWPRLRAAVGEAAGLCQPLPAGPGRCAVCRGPALPSFPRCFHCSLHWRSAPGLLADAVVPLSYSIPGTAYARMLKLYKSVAAYRAEACPVLRTLLLMFLHDHGRCMWASAGMARPSHAAVVPSGGGRSGVHPLRALVEPYLALPWAGLAACSGELVQAREFHTGRYRTVTPLPGARVLLLDDTWASGSSAQSAAAALKLAGARSVVTLVLGRHINPAHPQAASFFPALAGRNFRPDRCAVHEAA
jgi:hypothetical protein